MTEFAVITPEWIDELLQLTAPERRTPFLQSANLLNAQGLSQLLDQAMRLARSDPGKARQLTLICAAAAAPAQAPAILPRATYLRAQTYAINGDFNGALELIQSARLGYEALGASMEALRTNLGLIHIFNELGRHAEALDAGQAILNALESNGEGHPQAQMMAGIAHQNRGVCYETMGRYEEALQAYVLAEARFQAIGMTERIGDVSNNRGIVLVHLGRVSEALEAFESAARIWADSGLTLLQAQTLSNIGEAHLALGNYTHSLNAFEQARRLFEPLDAVANKRILLRKTADAYLALNLYPEALAVYREANELLKEAGMADHHARALWGMGAGLIAQSQYDEAAAVLAQAAALFETAGNIPMRCSVMLEQAALHQARGHQDAALQTAHEAFALVSEAPWPVQRLYACLRVADLLLPDTTTAEFYLLEAQQLCDSLNLPTASYRLNSRIGHMRLLERRDHEAQTYLETAVKQIESLRGNLIHEALRASFLRDKTAAYADLIQLHLNRGDALSLQEAFVVAEQAKSRALVDLLNGVITHHLAVADPTLAAQLHALQADLSAAYNQFQEISGDDTLAELQARVTQLEQKISRLRLQTTAQVAAPDPFAEALSWETLKAQLPKDVILLAYHILDDEILAFVYGQGELQVARHLSRAAVVQNLLQRLNAQWDRFRAGKDFAQRHMATLEKSTQRVLASLYTELVAPLEGWLKPLIEESSASLAIVPHGILHNVPFHALFDGGRYLLDRYEISYAPSATVFALCQQRRRRTPERALVIGLADEAIPAVTTEVQAVAGELRNAGVLTKALLDDEANLAALRTHAAGYDIVHLACHGLFRADNPLFSALKLHDGWLTAVDALQLDFTATRVTLSACESGKGTVLLGDEVIGLPRAFLGAGAATVVVSLWLVHDETTATLMTHWYRQLSAGVGGAAALRASQRALKESHPHPYYWAPFILTGQR